MSGSARNVPAPRHAHERRSPGRNRAAAGGGIAGLIGFGGIAIIGAASDFEPRPLLDALLPTARFAASAYVAGGATILALMLTLITFSISHELEFAASHYRRIRDVANLTTAGIIASVLLLILLSIPLGDADVESDRFRWIYYGVLLGGAVTGGLFISAVLMLHYAVRELIGVGEDVRASTLVITPDETGD